MKKFSLCRTVWRWLPLIIMGLLSLTAHRSFADTLQEKVYLQQILNTLNSLPPLIMAAKAQQPANSRMQFHYVRYQDNRGHWHNGLLEDVNAIRAGIRQKLQQPSIEPRTVQPLSGDYVPKGNS